MHDDEPVTALASRERRAQLAPWIAASIGCVLRIVWSMWSPMCRSLPDACTSVVELPPDEPHHMKLVSFLANHARMPTGDEARALDAGLYAMWSPLPHVPAATFSALAGHAHDAWAHPIFARLASVTMGTAMIFVVGILAARLFPTSNSARWAIPLFAALHPQLVYVQSYVNADALTILLCAMQVLLWHRVMTKIDVRVGVAQGVLGGALVLAKLNAIALAPATCLAWAIASRRRGGSRGPLAASALSAAITLVLVGAMLLYNAHRFPGDPLGTRTMYGSYHALHPEVPASLASRGVGLMEMLTRSPWCRWSFESHWAVFGHMIHRLPSWSYEAAALASIVALAGLVFGWVKRTLVVPKSWIVVSATTCASAIALSIWTSWRNDFQPQGRYLFPAFVPFMLLAFAGAASVSRRWGWCAAWSLVALVALLQIESIAFVLVPLRGFAP